MGAVLDALRRLQSIETGRRSIREQIESKRRLVEAHKRRLAKLERQITDRRDLIRKAQAEADRSELQRKTYEERIAKLRDALNHAKANKEYAAILTQLNTDKADALRVEDAVLTALGRVDDLKQQEAGQQAALEQEQAKVDALARAAADLESALSSQSDELQSQREAAAENIPPQAMYLFERACEKHDGEALAAIAQAHPKRAEYTCTGCHMSVTLETINALQSGGDNVRICQTCSRILYLDSPMGVAAR